jgi:hypothetical protein
VIPDGFPLPAAKDLRRRYGIGLEEYLELAELQGWVCAICGRVPTERTGTLRVDHDHDGELAIRGLLCNRCNRAATQAVARYFASPPARRLGWTVPAELEAKTIRRREAAKPRARERAKERRAERAGRNFEATWLQKSAGDQGKQNSRGGPSNLDRIRAMAGDTFHERTERALAQTRGGRR